jgi:hypothetical protein
MSSTLLPTTRRIRDLFDQEITAAGGTLSDVYDNGDSLFLRSILPRTHEVRRGDLLHGGVALRTTAEEILVHPYVFRQVCRNGAILAHALQTRRVGRVDASMPPDKQVEVESAVCEAIQACCVEEAFEEATDQIRSACELEADLIMQVLPWLARLPQDQVPSLLADIQTRFTSGRDSSRFGLMNAVTSVARDTRDPELRWRLEELGGAIPALRTPVLKPDGGAAVLARA